MGVRRFRPLNDIGGRSTPYVYLGPTLLMVLVFLIYPMFGVFRDSFADWSGFGSKSFAGLRNYITLANDPIFWRSLRTNLIYVISFSLLPVAVGFLFATLIGRSAIAGDRYYRAILLTPQVIASVAMGVIFRWIFSPGFGLLNDLLGKVGLEGLQRPWLGDAVLAPISVGLIGMWMWLGFAVIVFVAGIQKIPPELFEAASLDGASAWRQLRAITLPALRAELIVVIIVTLIRAFGSGVFGIVQAITEGRYNTMPLALYAYRVAFVQNRMGYGSAVSVFLVAIIVLMSAVTFRLGERREG